MPDSIEEALAEATQAPQEEQAPTPEATPEVTPPVEEPVVAKEEGEKPTTEQPTETPQEELYELPDGRKVDAKTLEHEWKNNFMPDYTKKSQALAERKETPPLQKDVQTEQSNKPQAKDGNTPPWLDPNWQPSTYQEILDASVEKLKWEQAQEQSLKQQAQEQITGAVEAQLAEIRKQEPNVSEELLFQHALKYKFDDLGVAFQNMRDMSLAVKKTEQRVMKNLQSRQEDPIAISTQTSSGDDGAIDYNSLSDPQNSPQDMLRKLLGKKG